MWDRVLFAVRRFGVDAGNWLGSWRLSVALMVVAALYYGFLAIWARASPPHVVRNIAALLPFWLVYGLLLINTLVCLWRRLPMLRRDLSRMPTLTDRPAQWEIETDSATGVEQAARLLRRLGYRAAWHRPGCVGGIRRRWAPLGTFLFHGAFFLLALGFILTLLFRQEAKVWVAVGEEYTGHQEQFLSMSPPRILTMGIPGLTFRVSDIRAEFWKDQLLFTTLEADLEFPEGLRTTRINRPLWVGPGAFLRLSGFGYAPRYEIADREEQVLESVFVKMNVFPPGQQDYFSPPGLPHRFYLEVLPDADLTGARPATRSLDLVDPAVVLRVFRGRLDLGGAVLRTDERFAFEGLSLGFPEIRYWGEFAIVQDPGAPVVFLAYAIGVAGLLLKIRGGREEAEWTAAPGERGTLKGWGGPPPSSLGESE